MTSNAPGALRVAAAFNMILGALYVFAGGAIAFDGISGFVALFFGGCGLAMVVGSIGLMDSREWGRRCALFGLGVALAVHGFCCMILLFAMIIGAGYGPPPNDVIVALTVYGLFTALQALVFYLIHRSDAHDQIWTKTESEIEVGEHEVVLEFADEPASEVQQMAVLNEEVQR